MKFFDLEKSPTPYAYVPCFNEQCFYRVEDKYLLSDLETYELKRILSTVLPIDHGKPYTISSLYFDDFQDSCLIDVENGQPHREKFRVRIYNDSLSVIKLEHKTKSYNRIHKVSSAISSEELDTLLLGNPLDWEKKANDARSVFNRALIERNLSPRIVVTYERTAFLFEAGNVRITFDENLRATRDVSVLGKSDVYYDYPRDLQTILEVKYDGFLPDFIGNLINPGSLWQTANSKYRICREIYNN